MRTSSILRGCAGVAVSDSDALLTIHWIVTELDLVTDWAHELTIVSALA